MLSDRTRSNFHSTVSKLKGLTQTFIGISIFRGMKMPNTLVTF